MKHPYRTAFFGIVNILLVVAAGASAWENNYSQSSFQMLCALYIHVVYLQGDSR